MVTGRRVDAGERLVAELEALGGDVRFVQTDMAEPEQRRLPAEHHRMTELRIAVLGASRMRGWRPSPAPTLGHRLGAVPARDRGRAVTFARIYGVERVVGSYADLVADGGRPPSVTDSESQAWSSGSARC